MSNYWYNPRSNAYTQHGSSPGEDWSALNPNQGGKYAISDPTMGGGGGYISVSQQALDTMVTPYNQLRQAGQITNNPTTVPTPTAGGQYWWDMGDPNQYGADNYSEPDWNQVPSEHYTQDSSGRNVYRQQQYDVVTGQRLDDPNYQRDDTPRLPGYSYSYDPITGQPVGNQVAPNPYLNPDYEGYYQPPAPERQPTADEQRVQQPRVGEQTVEQWLTDQMTNPTLAPGTEAAYEPYQLQQNELIDPALAGIRDIQMSDAVRAQVSQILDGSIPNVTPAQYEAALALAEQGHVNPESTVKYQLSQLYQDVENGNAPWAAGAVRAANQAMAKRGLLGSSMAGSAIAQSVMEAALPIAQYDANTFSEMNMQNLRNRQEAMLTNVAAQNAASQFNAQSENDVNMFMTDLQSRIETFNVEQRNQMNQFNADQENAVNEFQTRLQAQIEQFEAEQALVIAQSNAEWRRMINTNNTALENSRIAQDVQNRFNLSQQAMANIWQRARDAFAWANQSAENDRDRAFKLTVYSQQHNDFLDFYDTQTEGQFYQNLGDLAFDIVSHSAKKWISGDDSGNDISTFVDNFDLSTVPDDFFDN